MKIKVQHADGKIETLTLEGQWTVSEGKGLDRLTSGSGEHFFTKEGYYDGWGRVLSDATGSDRRAGDIERERDVEPSGGTDPDEGHFELEAMLADD